MKTKKETTQMIDKTQIYDHQLRLAIMDKTHIHTACHIHTEQNITIDPLELADNMLAFHIESKQIEIQIEESKQRAEDAHIDQLWDDVKYAEDYINDEHLLVIS